MKDNTTITEKDKELIQAAIKTLDRLYKKGRHEVAAALRCKDGKVYTGIHIEAKYSGYADICGEVAAICVAVADGQSEFDTIVAVVKDEKGDYIILEPCGRCRDVISDFGMDINVIIGDINSPQKVKIEDLIPHKSANPIR